MTDARRQPPRRGFTLVELLVVVAIITVLIGILLPTLARAREMANRTVCAGNLAAIGKAAMTYAAEDDKNRLPCNPPPYGYFGFWNYPAFATGQDGTASDAIASMFQDQSVGYPSFVQMGDPSANFWLLVLRGALKPKNFICPSDPNEPTAAMVNYTTPVYTSKGYFTNFGTVGTRYGTYTCSYGFAYPWTGDSVPEAWWWKSSNTDPATPLAADIGPSGITATDDPTATPGTAASNSKNHGGQGQYVLYFDAHASWSDTNRAGAGGDNIYTAGGNAAYVATGGCMFNDPSPVNASLGADVIDVIMTPAAP